MAVGQNNPGESQTCALPGCDNVITQSAGGGPPRKYCCGEHRLQARRVRYEARTATAAKPHEITKPARARSRGRAPARHGRRNGAGARRGVRAALALAGVSAVVAGLVPGDAGTRVPATDGEQARSKAPNRSTAPQPATAVDLRWVPRAKKVLAQVNGDLTRLGKAERAAAAVPRAQWSPRLRALMGQLEQRKAELLRQRDLLRADLSVVETYRKASAGLADVQQQLGLLNQARGSLQALSGTARDQMNWILNGLESQAGRLSQEEQSHRDTEESLHTPAVEASSKPLPELAGDVGSLAREVDAAAAASGPHGLDHGPNQGSDHGPGRHDGPGDQGGDGPRSDRPPSSPHHPPGKPTQTTAPPRPNPHPSSPPVSNEPPRESAPPPAPDPEPPAREAPAPEPPARFQTLNDGGGGGGDSFGDSGFGSTDSTDSTDSDVGSDDGSDVGSDVGSDAGADAGSDAGSDGSDGGDGGDGGF
jgi:outer membrane biosynthesis protein TonB